MPHVSSARYLLIAVLLGACAGDERSETKPASPPTAPAVPAAPTTTAAQGPATAPVTLQVELLAPTPGEYAATLGRLREQVEIARSIGEAASRVQNRLAEMIVAGQGTLGCDDGPDGPLVASLLARAPVFLVAFRDAVQSARVTGQRTGILRDAPTILPILDPDDRRDVDALEALVGLLVRSCLERTAWHARYLAAAEKRCAPEIVPDAGIEQAAPVASDDHVLPVAVIALGPEPVWPLGVPGNGAVLVISGGKACQGTGCTPVAVLPGAVLGPEAFLLEGPPLPPDAALPEGLRLGVEGGGP
jgi:hypothetical protein